MGMARGLADGLLRLCNGAWRDNDGDAVDIVEVIRCKDCKFYKDYPMGGKGCHTHYNGRTELIPREENDFCSYGERKDNG